MRSRLGAGILIGAILTAPLAAAVPASAIPLEPAAEQPGPVANPGCPGGAPHWDCLLSSLSSSGSTGTK